MELRIIKIRIPNALVPALEKLAEQHNVIDYWTEIANEEQLAANIILPSAATEALIADLEDEFDHLPDFKLVLQEVQATIPRPEEPEQQDSDESTEDEREDEQQVSAPISTDELYTELTAGMGVSTHYLTLVVLSTLVVAIGIFRNDVAIVIAGMILAPLLQPNMSLALGTTLGDLDLTFRSLRLNMVGFGTAIATSFAFGAIFAVDPTSSQILLRTKLGLLELLLAASAGAAGTLSVTRGGEGAIVGVMVAVALLPPAVIFGMLLGSGHFDKALGAFYLVAANLICLNLSGIVSFALQGIRPRDLVESDKASRAFWQAFALWSILLGILTALLVFGGEYRRYP